MAEMTEQGGKMRDEYDFSKGVRGKYVGKIAKGHKDMRKLTLYRDDSTTQVVFDNVKHFFFTANNSILTIAQYVDAATGEHRYIHWPRERFCWFKDEKVSGEAQ